MLIRSKNTLLLLMLLTGSSVMAQSGSQKHLPPFDFSRQNLTHSDHSGALFNTEPFDFLGQRSNGYSLQTKKDGLFGDEIIMGMKFSDLLSLRINVIENDATFLIGDYAPRSRNAEQLTGYHFGISSVVNLGSHWRLGLDLGHGQIDGDLLGLNNDKMNTTSLGLGVRYQNFGATLNSDFMTRDSNDLLEQSSLNLKVDWHFTEDGTISFGARKSVRENNQPSSSVLDRLTGTVPYIKFKHNL